MREDSWETKCRVESWEGFSEEVTFILGLEIWVGVAWKIWL